MEKLFEAPARARRRSVPSASDGRAKRVRRWMAAALWRFVPMRPRAWAGAALGAAMIGIVVNALTLQHVRHPSPFFAANSAPAPAPSKTAVAPTVAAVTADPATAAPPASSTSPVPPAPPIRPPRLGGIDPPAQATRGADPIAEVLRDGANKDPQHLLATAQAALVKLGYPVKIGGGLGADTATALRDFEKAHGLPISTEITPRLVKAINAAATSSASR